MTTLSVVLLALSSITTINVTMIAVLDWRAQRIGPHAVNGQLVRRTQHDH